MNLPTVEEMASQLQDVSGAESVDADAPLLQIGDVDSLDLMEWLYGFQSQFPQVPADESMFANIDDTTTLRTLHARLVALAPAA